MKKISEIFQNGFNEVDFNIIRTLDVNHELHYDGIINIFKYFEPNFIETDEIKSTITKLLYYFTGSSLFDGSLKKGIMLVGGLGTGKSLIFRVFKEYTGKILRMNSYQYHYSHEIVDNVNINGVEYLEKYNHNFGTPITCYVDDIASRNEIIKYFGTEVNVMEQLLSIRYNIYIRYRKLTHVTSNKYPSDFKELYDERVIDRMKEMFNIVELKGKSFRK